jgi:hypothetical protein
MQSLNMMALTETFFYLWNVGLTEIQGNVKNVMTLFTKVERVNKNLRTQEKFCNTITILEYFWQF